jgi:hypothetical protein
MSDSELPGGASARDLFQRYKSLDLSAAPAGFVLDSGGELEVLAPTVVRPLKPSALKARVPVKGLAGHFGKGEGGTTFRVLAGKGGARAGQSWVLAALRKATGASALTVVEDPSGDFDADPGELRGGRGRSQSGPPPRTGLDELDTLDGLDLLPGGGSGGPLGDGPLDGLDGLDLVGDLGGDLGEGPTAELDEDAEEDEHPIDLLLKEADELELRVADVLHLRSETDTMDQPGPLKDFLDIRVPMIDALRAARRPPPPEAVEGLRQTLRRLADREGELRASAQVLRAKAAESERANLTMPVIAKASAPAGAPAWVTDRYGAAQQAMKALRRVMQNGPLDVHRDAVDTFLAAAALVQWLEARRPLLDRGCLAATRIEPWSAVPTKTGEPLHALKAQIPGALQAWTVDAATADGPGFAAIVGELDRLLTAGRAAQLDRVRDAVGGARKGRKGEALQAALSTDPHLIEGLASSPEGRELLDGVVSDCGGKIEGKAALELVKSVAVARFGLRELKGDLSRKSMAKLYDVMASVPDQHTFGNDKLMAVKRNRNFKSTSWYSAGEDQDEGVGKHHIVIQGVRSGGFLGFGADLLSGLLPTSKYRKVKGSKSMDAFAAVTLHEIGHGVDEKHGFMDRLGSEAKYGGWLQHSPDEVVSLAAEHFGFYADHPHLERHFLQAWLRAALRKGFEPAHFAKELLAAGAVTADQLRQDRGVARAIAWRAPGAATRKDRKAEARAASRQVRLKGAQKALAERVIFDVVVEKRSIDAVLKELTDARPPGQIDVEALGSHPATRWCEAVRMRGQESGLWEQLSDAKKLAIDGRVVLESYPGDWCSFDVRALDRRVTNYQLRSPAEWFADAYSVYFLKKLPDDHPLKGWLDEQKQLGHS